MDTRVCLQVHHRLLEEVQAVQAEVLGCRGVTYLQDSSFVFEKAGVRLKLWGSPWTLANGNPGKAFQVPEEELSTKWEVVPADTDVLVTHCPAWGRRDTTKRGQAAGCRGLAGAVARVRPLLHLCGHIHEARGVLEEGGTVTVNAANCDGEGKLAWPPTLIGHYFAHQQLIFFFYRCQFGP